MACQDIPPLPPQAPTSDNLCHGPCDEKQQDAIWSLVMHQIKGVAMGMSPAPTIANLFVAIYEAKKIIPLIGTYLLLLRWFIDDGFGI